MGTENANKKIIFESIVSHREFTIPQIAGISKLSVPTVTKYVSELHRANMLEQIGEQEMKRKGRRATIYRIKPDYCYFLGVDVKAFELNLGIMNFAGDMLYTKHIDTFCFDNTKYNVDAINSHIDEFIQEYQIEKSLISRAHFNIGGRVNSLAGTSASVFNFEDNQETPLAVSLARMIEIPVTIENDSKAMAYGELMCISNPSWKNILYVNAGWGLGLGIIINGELYYGKDGYAGEFGHIYHYKNDVMCHCGKKGCIETEISGRAIVRLLKEQIYGEHKPCILSDKAWKREAITTMDLVNAVKSGDLLCQELFMETGRKLGAQLAGLINLFNPDCIIVGGYLAEVPEQYFINPVKESINKYSFSLMNQHLPVITSRLGLLAGVTGGCLIARNKMLQTLV